MLGMAKQNVHDCFDIFIDGNEEATGEVDKREEYIEDRTALNDTHDAMLDNWNANVKAEHPYDGFNFNTEPVTTQVAAVDAVVATYYGPLTNGVVDDVEASFNEFKEMLDKAGMRDIIAELEKQAAEHVAAK